jgi:hypothetical protein
VIVVFTIDHVHRKGLSWFIIDIEAETDIMRIDQWEISLG